MWYAKNMCVCCMFKTQDYKKLNEIEFDDQPLRVYEILYRTVPPMEQINKQNLDQLTLPDIICLTCYGNLLRAYKFQEKCLASLQKLQKLWDEHNLETPMSPLNKLQTKEEIKMEIDVESYCVQSEFIDEPRSYYNKDLEQQIETLEKGEEEVDFSGDITFSNAERLSANDEEILPIKKKSAGNNESQPHNYSCNDCGKTFNRAFSLKRHSLRHSLVVPAGGFECPDCPRRFEKKASLAVHLRVHAISKPEATCSCMICGTLFTSVDSLRLHTASEHPERYKCDQCDETFALHALLLKHLNSHKANQTWFCLICEKEFGDTNALKEHMCIHSGVEKSFMCTECGKSFKGPHILRRHMEIHRNLRQYQCPDCPSRFNTHSCLIKHTVVHSNAKPHVCDVCGRSFSRLTTLKKHKKLHTGERPYKCDQCNMTFAISYYLRRHTRTHTGEKPYKCKFCDRAYSESGDLTKHLRTHVGKNTYMCEECPMAFKYQAELKQHQAEHYKAALKLLE